MFTEEIVNQYAESLLIGLSKEENEMVLKEFDVIKNNMDIITSIPNINKVEAMTHALDDFKYSLREDEYTESLNIEDITKNCDSIENDSIVVPKVVGE